jgi:hypothetical protein
VAIFLLPSGRTGRTPNGEKKRARKMSHEWNKGALIASSWHGLESVVSMETAADLISAGETTGAYPIAVNLESISTSSGLSVPGSAVVATYADNSRKAHSAVGAKYTPLDPKEWRATIEAAVAAGAKPAGAFSLRGGERILATFEIPGGNGGTHIANYLNLVDTLDGSLQFMAGGTSVRTVCANTLAASFGKDGKGYAKIRHTASINDRAEALREAIEIHVKEGEKVASLYREAVKAKLSRNEALAVFEALFPAAKEGDSKRLATRRENVRAEAAKSMKREENFEGQSVATIWNAATWMVDRTADGKPRDARGGADRLDSLLFGSRSQRIAEIRNTIEVVLRDGSIAEIEATEAAEHGIDNAQIGRAIMAEMLG